MSLKWRAQTSGTSFPFGIRVLPWIRDDDDDDDDLTIALLSSTRFYDSILVTEIYAFILLFDEL